MRRARLFAPIELSGMVPPTEAARRVQMKQPPKISEHTCSACNGTGFPKVKQPAQPGRRIYPVQCKACAGKGKIADAGA
jgi:DnaJ-class molecular chaperone